MTERVSVMTVGKCSSAKETVASDLTKVGAFWLRDSKVGILLFPASPHTPRGSKHYFCRELIRVSMDNCAVKRTTRLTKLFCLPFA